MREAPQILFSGKNMLKLFLTGAVALTLAVPVKAASYNFDLVFPEFDLQPGRSIYFDTRLDTPVLLNVGDLISMTARVALDGPGMGQINLNFTPSAFVIGLTQDPLEGMTLFYQTSFQWEILNPTYGFSVSSGTGQMPSGDRSALGFVSYPNYTNNVQSQSAFSGFRASIVVTGINGVSRPLNTAYFILGSVPEPETWVMMIIGFSLVGGAMRRPRQTDVAHTQLRSNSS